MDQKNNQKKTITPKQAAEIYGLDEGTLANMRYQKRGPRYFRCGRKVFYLVTDLEAWLLSNPILTIDHIRDHRGE